MSVAGVGKTAGAGAVSAAGCGGLGRASLGSWGRGPQAVLLGGRASPFGKRVSAFAEPGLTLCSWRAT